MTPRRQFQSRPSLQFENLEHRNLLAANLFVDFGDNFAGGILSTTQGALRDVADDPVDGERILGVELEDASNNFNAGTQLDIVAQTFSATDRSRMLAVIRRAYEPLDINVVELTSTPTLTVDGRSVSGAANMGDVVNTLRAGNAGWKDAYIFVATFIVDPGGADQQIYGNNGGGTSPSGTVLGALNDRSAGSNLHDDVAVVYSNGGFSYNTMNNISHEAGHNLGLRHSITNPATTAAINLFHQAEIMSYRNTNNTSSSMFTRYPMIRGDGNSPGGDPVDYNDLAAQAGQVTLFDQLRFDTNVQDNSNYTFISGTGAHDIITVSRNGAVADVSIQAFANSTYTSAITVPGEADSTYSFTIPLTRSILIYGGDSNDRFVIDGDLGVDLMIDGMLGTDELIIDGKGAALATYLPSGSVVDSVDLNAGTPIDDYSGTIQIGLNSISFNNFESDGRVEIQDVVSVQFVAPAFGVDDLLLTDLGTLRLSGSVNNGIDFVPVRFTSVNALSIATGAANDVLEVEISGANPFPGGAVWDGGSGQDTLDDESATNNLFTIDGVNSGNLDSFLAFDFVESLIGNSMDDEFRFTGAGRLDGSIIGLLGVNHLNYGTKVSAALNFNSPGLSGFDGTVDGGSLVAGGFEDIAEITGSVAGVTDSVTGLNANADWTVDNNMATYSASGQSALLRWFEFLIGNAQVDSYAVLATSYTVHLSGEGNNDLFALSSDGLAMTGNVNAITGDVNVDGGTGDNQLVIADVTGSGNTNVIVTNNAISGIAPAVVNYTAAGAFHVPGNFNGIWLKGSNSLGDQIVVQSLFIQHTLQIDGGFGVDSITTLDQALGDMQLDGGEDSDFVSVAFVGGVRRVNAYDSGVGDDDTLEAVGTAAGDNIVIRDKSVSFDVNDRIWHNSNTEHLLVRSLIGDDVFNIKGSSAGDVDVQLGDGDDFVRLIDTGNIVTLDMFGGNHEDRVRIDEIQATTTTNVEMGADWDRVFVGSNLGDNNGLLDLIAGPLSIDGGNTGPGEDRLYLNDHGTAIGHRYELTEAHVLSLTPRVFSQLLHSNFEVVRLDGTDQADEFVVHPNALNRFVVDGNLPTKEMIDCPEEGDFLNLVADASTGRTLTLTNPANGEGHWTFTNGFQGVYFREIERFNHVARLAVGSDAFEGSLVRVLDAETRDELFQIAPYESTFTGGVRVATGDVTGDGIPDIITAPGAGRAPEVKIYDGLTGTFVNSFFAYADTMRDGVMVATGDVSGSCAEDIVTAPGPGHGKAEVRVFENNGGGFSWVDSFFPFGQDFYGGASVATGDFNGDGIDDIVAGALHGEANVAIFDGSASGGSVELARFNAFGPGFFGGVHVAVGNVMGDDTPDLLVSTGHNVWANQFDSQVHVYDGASLPYTPFVYQAPDFAFQAFNQNADASVRITVKDFDLDGIIDEIFASHGPHGETDTVQIFEPLNPSAIDSLFNGDPAFTGGIFVG